MLHGKCPMKAANTDTKSKLLYRGVSLSKPSMEGMMAINVNLG